MAIKSRASSYIQMDKGLCIGCVLCMKACPTKAIRVRDGKATRVGDKGIDCGECIRVCPKGAIRAVTTWSGKADLSPYSVVGASPVLYAQFGNEAMPNDILIALRRIFNYVYDQAYAHEIYNAVTELYIKGNRGKGEAVLPLISPVCPVVNRLIAMRFPSLLKQVLPFMPPREFAAREMRKRFRQKKIFGDNEATVYQVSPCAAKMISIQAPMFTEKSYLSGAVGIRERPRRHRRGEEGHDPPAAADGHRDGGDGRPVRPLDLRHRPEVERRRGRGLRNRSLGAHGVRLVVADRGADA